MDISVVIPTYNRADLIPFTLDSIFGQTMSPREVIVVDDGSRDDTRAVLARYGDRIRSIVIPNSGSIVARNTGLRAATHPLVAFCDSDDLWLPNFLERMAALWRAEPATKVAYANFRIVRDGVWLDEAKFEAAPGDYWDELRRLGDGLGMFDFPIVDRIVRFQPFFQSAVVADRVAILAAGGGTRAWTHRRRRFRHRAAFRRDASVRDRVRSAGGYPQASRQFLRRHEKNESRRREYPREYRAANPSILAGACGIDPSQHRHPPARRDGRRFRGPRLRCCPGYLPDVAGICSIEQVANQVAYCHAAALACPAAGERSLRQPLIAATAHPAARGWAQPFKRRCPSLSVYAAALDRWCLSLQTEAPPKWRRGDKQYIQ